MKTIGQCIAIERVNRRWTQDRLAAELGIKQSLLSDIENDKISPKWNLIMLIAEKLEMQVSDLLPAYGNAMYGRNFNDNSGGIINYSHEGKNDTMLWQDLVKAKDEIITVQKQLIEALQRNKH